MSMADDDRKNTSGSYLNFMPSSRGKASPEIMRATSRLPEHIARQVHPLPSDVSNVYSIASWDCTLFHHDYLGAELKPLLDTSGNARKCDLVFADPPYNIGVKYDGDETKDRMSFADYQRFTLDVMVAMLRKARPGATFWWMTPEEHGDWTGDMLTRIVGPRLYRIIWQESFAQYQARSLTKDYRFIFCHRVSNDGEVTFNPDDIRVPSARQVKYKDKRANPKGRVPGQVWDIRRLQGTSNDRVDWHPAQLPPELLARIVKGWSKPGDLVMDAFAGSGSMAKVCRTLGRGFFGVERSQLYIDKMVGELT